HRVPGVLLDRHVGEERGERRDEGPDRGMRGGVGAVGEPLAQPRRPLPRDGLVLMPYDQFETHDPWSHARAGGQRRLAEAIPGGAAARALWMASTRASADSSVSSSATRAEGPSAGLTKSMFTVCSWVEWYGWST